MSESVGAIYYTVEADTAGLVSGGTAGEKSLDGLEKQFKRTDKAAGDSQFQMTKTAQAVKNLGRESNAASSQLSGLTRLLGGVLSLQGARGLIEMAEAYNEMAERVQMATSSAAEYEMVQSRLLDTANRTYRALSEAQEVYILTADSVRSLGYSTESALDITDSLSYAFVKNATSTDRANSAVSAFTKALNKGKVEADGWETLVAAIPTIVNDIATASGKTTQQIRELGVSGGVTARMLTEGLRSSLDENKKAADGMATTLKDAFRALSNNLSVYVGEANRSSGATGLLSSSIIALGENIDTVVKLLLVAGAGALAKYVSGLTASALASAQAALQARLHAAEELKAAVATEAQAAAASAAASRNAALGGSHAAAATASEAHAAASRALAVAQAGVTSATKGILAVLGGPIGLIALVASAAAGFLLFRDNANQASQSASTLAANLDKLGRAQLDQRAQQAALAIEKQKQALDEARRSVQGVTKDYEALSKAQGVTAEGLNNVRQAMVDANADVETQTDRLKELIEAQKSIDAEREKRKSGPTSAPAPAAGGDAEVAKRLQELRDEAALSKLAGAARAKLAATQKLGANATKEEREEAEKLAETIYRNSEASKSATSSAKAATEARKKDREVLADMAEDLQLAALHGEALAVAKAKNQLSGFATPQQIADLERMAKALFAIDQQNQKRQKFGDTPQDADQYIMGNVSPLSGGAFDDQFARYKAEAEAEQKRYAEQQERLITARQLQIDTKKSYDQLEEEAAKQHADRMQQIEDAKNRTLLASGETTFGALADVIRESAGDQSAAYKAAFAVAKAFAIAKATMAVKTAIAEAAASGPFPWNLGAMASVAAATAGLVGSISGVSMGGGRQYGGGVAPNKMHRINENGQPEVLNMANGQQYLLPNSRGQVVSNKDATTSSSSGGINLTVQLFEDQSRAGQVDQSRVADDEYIVRVVVADIMGEGDISRAGGQAFGWQRRGR